MALVISDRVKETTTTSGTGTYTLGGAVTGFETFTANLSDGDTTYYACTDNTDFEVGLGTFTASGTTLARTTILASSNSGSAVNWAAGTRTIFCTLPAAKTVFLDASNVTNISNLKLASGATVTAILDEDTLSSNSDTSLATQQSIKAYVDAQVTAQDLDFQGDTGGALSIDLDSEVLDIAGGTGIDTSGSANTLTVSIDSTVATLSGTQTLTNKSIDASQLTGTVANARLDAQLQDVAGLAVTDGNFIVGDGANFVAESGATARTSLGLGTAAVTNTGISNGNVLVADSTVADDDFLRINGTSVEGRSASEVLSDIGGQASLTFGIANTNAVQIDSASVADDEYARFTANGLESRSNSEVLSDIGAVTEATAEANAVALAIALG